MRISLLIAAILALQQGNILCSSIERPAIPAPLSTDMKINLSAEKCGKRKSLGDGKKDPYPWRVAIGSGTGNYCFGVRLSLDTVITVNCKEFAIDFIKDKDRFKAYYDECFKLAAAQKSPEGCNHATKLTSVKMLKSKSSVDIQVWGHQYAATRSLCLFNQASDDTSLDYYVFDRKWDTNLTATMIAAPISKDSGPPDVLFIKTTEAHHHGATFDFLISHNKTENRYHLRGLFYWDLFDRKLAYIDVLPLVYSIIKISNYMYVMPQIPKNEYQPTQFDEKFGINAAGCGHKGTTRRRRFFQPKIPEPFIKVGIPRTNSWTALIETKDGHQCGGTLISKRIILTAAHCVLRSDLTSYIVTVGITYLSNRSPGQSLQPIKVIKHDQHKNETGSSNQHNIALMIFAGPGFDKAKPICLWDNRVATFDVFKNGGVVTGWGLNSSNVEVDALQEAPIEIPTYKECYLRDKTFFSKFLKPRQQFCVAAPGKVHCNGGAGIAVNDGRGKWYLRGVASYGPVKRVDWLPYYKACDETKPMVMVDIAWYAPWIRDTLNSYY